jgi:hypothetical protein
MLFTRKKEKKKERKTERKGTRVEDVFATVMKMKPV